MGGAYVVWWRRGASSSRSVPQWFSLRRTKPLAMADNDSCAVRLRSVAVGDPAYRRRQSGQMEELVWQAIPRAEELYSVYLKERAEEEGR